MSCRSDDEIEPTMQELQLLLTAKLLVYFCQRTGVPVEAWMTEAVRNPCHSGERCAPELCKRLHALEHSLRTHLLFNTNEELARQLRFWWKKHCIHDAVRDMTVKKKKQN